MKLISWNVNGLRACLKKGCWDWIAEYDPDVICFQETKVDPADLADSAKNPDGFHSYFDHAKEKKGYSGVAIYTKEQPEKVEYGLGIKEFDQEGRFLAAYYKDFILFNVYFPNGGGGPARLKFKLDYYKAFLEHVEALRKQGKSLVICGDVNTAHKEIDLARPKENQTNTGFLPVERAWLDQLTSLGYVDTFRHFYPDKKNIYTYWDMKTFSRDRNVGWRIDYFYVTSDLLPRLKSATIFENVYGSDHCPIGIELK